MSTPIIGIDPDTRQVATALCNGGEWVVRTIKRANVRGEVDINYAERLSGYERRRK